MASSSAEGRKISETRVLIAGGQPSFLQALKEALAKIESVVIVGEAKNGAEAVGQAERLRPNVVIIAQDLPGMSADSVMRRIKAKRPKTRVWILADEEGGRVEAVGAGADGYFVNGDSHKVLTEAVKKLHAYRQLPRLMSPTVKPPDFTPRERRLGILLGITFGLALLVSIILYPRISLPTIALICGFFFLLYGLKYYASVALILLATSGSPNGNGNGNGLNGVFNGMGVTNGLRNHNDLRRPGLLRALVGRILGWDPNGGSNGMGNGNRNNLGNGRSLNNGNGYRFRPSEQPFISIHLPLYNETRVVDRLLEACTRIDYHNYEILVADDSTDETIHHLEKWAKHPKVKVSHRINRTGFKGAALKHALEVMDPRTRFIAIFDADFIPPPTILHQFISYFFGVNGNNGNNHINGKNGHELELIDESLAVVQGYQWHVLNASENWITRGVRTEFSGSYVVERPGQELTAGMKMISGSVFMIRADLLRDVGWGTSITEDWELTIRLYLEGYRVLYSPFIQAPAECVSDFKQLARQRMRWAEGHTFNVKKYFLSILRSTKLTRREKLEFYYYVPYYLQSVFFLIGTGAWFFSEIFLRTHLPFWTATFGWSLVFTNTFALIFMNVAGLFLERGIRRNIAGLLSFVLLTFLLVPYQAYAAIKGLLEPHEGGWHRTDKTGVITDIIDKLGMGRRMRRLMPKKQRKRGIDLTKRLGIPAAKIIQHLPEPLRRLTSKTSLAFRIFVAVVICLLLLSIFSSQVPIVFAAPDSYYLRDTKTNGATPAGQDMADDQGASGMTLIFDSTEDQAFWYTDVMYPTSGEDTKIGSGEYSLQMVFTELPDAWWDTSYLYRQPITITAGSTDIPVDAAVRVELDHTSLTPSKSNASGKDVHVVYWDGSGWIEINRWLDDQSSWDSKKTQIWFQTQAAIAARGSDSNYYLYYGNNNVESPPTGWSVNVPVSNDLTPEAMTTLKSEQDAPLVKIVVGVYHTDGIGGIPQKIVTSAPVIIDSNIANPYPLLIGKGEEQTFTASDPRRLRLHITVEEVNGGGSFSLAYNTKAHPSELETPGATVPGVRSLLLLAVIFIPISTSFLTNKRWVSFGLAVAIILLALIISRVPLVEASLESGPQTYYFSGDTTPERFMMYPEESGGEEHSATDMTVHFYTDVWQSSRRLTTGKSTIHVSIDSQGATDPLDVTLSVGEGDIWTVLGNQQLWVDTGKQTHSLSFHTQDHTFSGGERLRVSVEVPLDMTLFWNSVGDGSQIMLPGFTRPRLGLATQFFIPLFPVAMSLVMRKRRLPMRIISVILATLISMSLLANQVLLVSAAPDSFYLRDTTTNGASPAGEDMNLSQGSSLDTLLFDDTSDQAYWYSELTYPTGDDDATIAAGNYSFNMYFKDKVTTGTCSIANTSSSTNCSISPALNDTTKTFMIFQATSSNNEPNNSSVRCYITSTSNITCDRNGTTGVVNIAWQTAEFRSGVTVEHLTPVCNVDGDGDPDITNVSITAVSSMANTFLLYSHKTSGATHDSNDPRTVRLTSTTNVEIRQSGYASCASGSAGALQVVQFSGASVTRGLTGAMTGLSLGVSSLSSVTLSRTMLLYSYRYSGGGAVMCDRMVRGEMDSATSLSFSRGDGNSSCDTSNDIDAIAWERVQFPSGTNVQQKEPTMADTGGTDNESITSVDQGHTLVFSGGQHTAGQSHAEGSYTGDDIIGAFVGRHTLTAANNLRVVRDNTNGSARWTSYVVEFPVTFDSVTFDVSVHHTTSSGGSPTQIVTTSATVDSTTANPYSFVIGNDADGETYTSSNPQRLRLLVDVTSVTGNGNFELAYDSTEKISSMDTPGMTIPEWTGAFLVLVPLIPFLMATIWRRKRLLANFISILIACCVAVGLLSLRVPRASAKPMLDVAASNTFWWYDDTTPLQYMMYQSQPSGTSQSQAGAATISFYSDTWPNTWQINAGTSTVYFYVQTTGVKKVDFELFAGSGASWTSLGTGSWSGNQSTITLVNTSFSTSGYTFSTGERLRLDVLPANGATVYWDGSYNNSRLVIPGITVPEGAILFLVLVLLIPRLTRVLKRRKTRRFSQMYQPIKTGYQKARKRRSVGTSGGPVHKANRHI